MDSPNNSVSSHHTIASQIIYVVVACVLAGIVVGMFFWWQTRQRNRILHNPTPMTNVGRRRVRPELGAKPTLWEVSRSAWMTGGNNNAWENITVRK